MHSKKNFDKLVPRIKKILDTKTATWGETVTFVIKEVDYEKTRKTDLVNNVADKLADIDYKDITDDMIRDLLNVKFTD